MMTTIPIFNLDDTTKYEAQVRIPSPRSYPPHFFTRLHRSPIFVAKITILNRCRCHCHLENCVCMSAKVFWPPRTNSKSVAGFLSVARTARSLHFNSQALHCLLQSIAGFLSAAPTIRRPSQNLAMLSLPPTAPMR